MNGSGDGIDAGRAKLAPLPFEQWDDETSVYSDEWRVGDTVIWDNRGVFHRAVPYDAASHRR